MRNECRLGAAVVLGLLAFTFSAAAAAAEEVWQGPLGGGTNWSRSSKPASALGPVWSTAGTIESSEAMCVTYAESTVFTWVKDSSTDDYSVLAVDGGTGEEVWSDGAFPAIKGCVGFSDEKVVFAHQRESDGRWIIESRDSATGSADWDIAMPAGVTPTNRGLTLSGGKVLVTSIGPGPAVQLQALDLEEGDVDWTQPLSSDYAEIAAASEGVVVIESTQIRAFAISDGHDLNWPSDGAGLNADVGIRDGMAFHLRYDSNQVYVVGRNLDTGTVAWSKNNSCGSYSPWRMAVDAARVYVVCNFNFDVSPSKVVALRRSDGNLLWSTSFEGNGASIFVLGDRVYADGFTGQQWSIFNSTSGVLIGSTTGYQTQDGGLGATGYADGRFYQWSSSDPAQPYASPFALIARGDVTAPDLTISGPTSGSYKSSSALLAWQGDDGLDNEMDRFEIRVNGTKVADPDGSESSLLLTSLPPGINQIEVKGFDLAGNSAVATRSITIDPSPVPVAILSGPTGPVLSGNEVDLDASASQDSVLDGTITKYEWDLNGDGTFETDGGSTPTISTELTQLGVGSIGVKVTNDSGNSASKSVPVDVRRKPLPGAGLVGVSVNDAALFTNDPVVKLKVSWPALASDLAISNDGGFATSSSFPLPASGIIEWTLNSSGPERLPKQVYVRYYGAGNDTVTYSDDIILDQTPPVIDLAAISGAATAASVSLHSVGPAASASKAKRKKYRIRLKARDSTSGVIAVQAAKTKKVKGPVVQIGKRANRVTKTINPRVKYRPNLIRVKDAAGNWSRFRKVK